jgi:hypothetical protein
MSALRRWLAIVMAIAVMLGTLLVPLAAAAAPIRKSGLPVPLREPMEQAGEPDTPWNRARRVRGEVDLRLFALPITVVLPGGAYMVSLRAPVASEHHRARARISVR